MMMTFDVFAFRNSVMCAYNYLIIEADELFEEEHSAVKLPDELVLHKSETPSSSESSWSIFLRTDCMY
jgi:hypothetical protein